MTDKVNGSATPFVFTPVHELLTLDGNGPTGCVPFAFIQPMG